MKPTDLKAPTAIIREDNRTYVKQVRLHAAIHMPGAFETDKVIPSQRTPNVFMVLHEAGLRCEYKDLVFIIPYVNIQAMILGKEAQDVPKA